MSVSIAAEDFIRSLLPFDSNAFGVALSRHDEFALAAAAGGAFASVVRACPEVFQSRSERLSFCVDVSQSGFFAGGLPVWMAEAAIQDALGNPAAVIGVASEFLAEIHVVSLELMAGRIVNKENASRFIDGARRIAGTIERSLPRS